MQKLETDVIIIGGGATGACTARDLSMRFINTVLIERDDIASGTSGRNHGLLHSGARYAVYDIDSARECIAENKILKKTASHCIEDTGGLFVTLYHDDPKYHDRLLNACKIAGIKAKEISTKEALSIEPNLSPYTMKAIKVPDAIIDPFRLTSANILDAQERGAKILTHTLVTGIIVKDGKAAGVECVDAKNERYEIYAKIIVNASGIWGQHICELAGIELKMLPSKGSMLIIDYRTNNIVLNRCRPPSDGDIVVPGDTVSIIGTTSRKVEYDKIEDLTVEDDEIDVLLKNGEELLPNVNSTRALRAYCGVRPLIAASADINGRKISRGIVLIDHHERDGLDGLITITGGKLITCRLMAEKTADLICHKLSLKGKCITHMFPLPGSEKARFIKQSLKIFTSIPALVVGSTVYRHGRRVLGILTKNKKNYRLICECEMVSEGEVEYALKKLNVSNLIDLRRRTRISMGPCQGVLCAYRSAGLSNEYSKLTAEESIESLKALLEERWKGIKPVLWGDGLREIELAYWIYQDLFGLGDIENTK